MFFVFGEFLVAGDDEVAEPRLELDEIRFALELVRRHGERAA